MAQQFGGPAVFAKDQSLIPSTEFGQLQVLGEESPKPLTYLTTAHMHPPPTYT